MSKDKKSIQKTIKEEVIYLTIDHLKKGKYRLDVLLKDEIVKSIKIIK